MPMEVRGIVHAYSSYSHRGSLSLLELKKALFKHGYSFCCVTEEASGLDQKSAAAFVGECRQLSDQAFVFIPGFAVSYQDLSLLHIGTGVFLGQKADEVILKAWREVTPLLVLARDPATLLTADLPVSLSLDGVEVWNQYYDGRWTPHFATLEKFSAAKKRSSTLRAIGGLGIAEPKDHETPEIVLEVDKVGEPEIIRQLKLGFYTVEGGRVIMNSDGTFAKGGGLFSRVWSWLRGVLYGWRR